MLFKTAAATAFPGFMAAATASAGLAIFAVFVAVSTMHCVSIGISASHLERSTKPLLMPLLLLSYVLCAKSPALLPAAALLAGFAGDVFLLGTGTFFMLGLFSFLLGHIFYILALLWQLPFAALPAWALLLAVVPVFFGVILYRKLSPYVKSQRAAIIAYLLVGLTMFFSSLLRLLATGAAGAGVCFTGALLFVASDSMLSYELFVRHRKWRAVMVMVTYIAGQTLIAIGFMMLG
ncbi:MAG: lysoplasmalogenase [Clostridia bacterium]|nr:lysoplasmalogenase [Clostridia bacterium]